MSAGLLQSRISLISRKDIRWEGILVQVDRENASVTLRDVKSWGTEGRLEGDQQIPPSDHLHACVNFRGEDIKDLHVHETAEPPAPPPAPPVETPPPPPTAPPATAAAIRVAPDAAAGGAGQARAGATEDGDAGAEGAAVSSTMRDQGLKPGRYQPPHKNPNWKPPPTVQRGPPGPGSGAGSGTGALPGQGNHLLNRRTRGAGAGPVDEEGEFDFEAGLAKFDKEKEMALLAGGISMASIHDTIDSSTPHMNGGAADNSSGGGGDDANGIANGGDDGAGAGSVGQSADGGGGGSGGGGGGGGAERSAAAAAAAVAAAAASRAAAAGEPRSAADGGGEVWVEPPVVVKKYNKSSFFDEISCDALDGRGRMHGGRGGERTRNTETFGATSVALVAGSRRYGGRGGGGYNSYTGGRRGGYNDRQGGDNSYRGQYPHGGSGGGGGGGGGGRGNRQETGGTWRRS